MEEASTIDRIRAWLVVVATIGTITFNWLAAIGYVNGVTPAEISDKYPTVITPAGYAFTIWSLIYLGLIGFSIYQLLPSNLARHRDLRSPFLLSCALNCVWLFLWHSDLIIASFIVIAALFLVLVRINIKIGPSETLARALFVRAPFGLYLGWLAAAMLVNLSILLVSLGIDLGQAANPVGAGLILLAAAFGVVMRVKTANYIVAAAIAWALTAIAVKQSGNTLIVSAAAVGVIACLIAAFSFVLTLKDSTYEQR